MLLAAENNAAQITAELADRYVKTVLRSTAFESLPEDHVDALVNIDLSTSLIKDINTDNSNAISQLTLLIRDLLKFRYVFPFFLFIEFELTNLPFRLRLLTKPVQSPHEILLGVRFIADLVLEEIDHVNDDVNDDLSTFNLRMDQLHMASVIREFCVNQSLFQMHPYIKPADKQVSSKRNQKVLIVSMIIKLI